MQNSNQTSIDFENKLRSCGYRVTSTKREIFEILKNSNKPLTIKDIYSQIDSSHFVSVYRSIDVMHKAQIIKLVPRGFKNLFELSDLFKPHHHHSTCEKCGKSSEVVNKELEKMMLSITKESGLMPTRHYFELFGICNDCNS